MKAFVDNWGNYQQHATITVQDDRPYARVTYRNEAGKQFRVNVVQRANPIGFRAKLPGSLRPCPS